jgi:hypothetical protein
VEASEWIALVAVIVSPAAALAGAWLNSSLAARGRRQEAADRAREQAIEGVAQMKSLLLDAVPRLIVGNELREYESLEEAVDGLYARWLKAREPLVLVHVAHRDPEVRHLAYRLQAEAEVSLRLSADAAKAGEVDDNTQHAWEQAHFTADELGQRLSPFLSVSP